jgi:hypothetical protein
LLPVGGLIRDETRTDWNSWRSGDREDSLLIVLSDKTGDAERATG